MAKMHNFTLEEEKVIPCRTKEDAQEFVDRWLDKANEVL